MKILLSLLVASFSLAAFTPRAATSLDDLEQWTGSVESYRLDMHGSIYVKMLASAGDGDELEEVWFQTAADKSAVINVEEMVLQVLLHLPEGKPLTVVVEQERGRAGTERDEALPIVSLIVD